MNTNQYPYRKNRPAEKCAGLTLIELLVVVLIIGILVVIMIPVIANVREQARQSVCSGNLRALGFATFIYANENNGRLPEITVGYWPHDIDRTILDELGRVADTNMDMFYCPSDVSPGRWARWHNLSEDYMSISYVLLYQGTINVRPQYWNATIDEPAPFEIRGVTYYEPPSQRVLAVDAVMSRGGLNGNFHRIPTPAVALDWYDQTNHLTGGTSPAGANVLFMDGHVEWRPWEKIVENRHKYGARTAGIPEFYW